MVVILHFIGSADNEGLFETSLLYTRSCQTFGKYTFKYILCYPDGTFTFPESLGEEAILSCEKFNSLVDVSSRIKATKPDLIIQQAFGIKSCTTYRRFLESQGFPVVGPKPECHYISCDKILTRTVLQAGRVSIPPGFNLNKDEKQYIHQLFNVKYPIVVKVPTIDDSKGVYLCRDEKMLDEALEKGFALEDNLILEKFIRGRELRCGVIENENNEKVFLPPMEFGIDENNIRGFENKLITDNNGKLKPAGGKKWFLDPKKEGKEIEKIKEVAFKAFEVMELQDFAIFDLRMNSEGNVFILESNLYCSFGEKSFIHQMVRESGTSDEDFVDMVVRRVISRKL